MGVSQLGAPLSEVEIDRISSSLESLTGEQPNVTYPVLPPSVAVTPQRRAVSGKSDSITPFMTTHKIYRFNCAYSMLGPSGS